MHKKLLGMSRPQPNSAAAMGRLCRGPGIAWALGVVVWACCGPTAIAPAWHLDSSFGRHGLAGVPFREEGIESLYPPGPGSTGSLLAQGPHESLFVGGYANRQPGSFLVARMSARGTLERQFGDGGAVALPAIYSTPQHPPRMFALPAGKLLVVGLDRAHRLTLVRLTARGRPDRAFGHDGVAQYSLPGAHGHAILVGAAVEPNGRILVVYYPREVPQPVNEPRITPGLGAGPLKLVRLLPSGALDPSFGKAGFLTASGQPPAIGEGSACGVTVAPDGSVLLAYEQAAVPSGNLAQAPAVQELSPTGADAPGFGSAGVAYLPSPASRGGVSSVLLGGLFALAQGRVEVSFGGAGQLFRLSALGTPENTFGASGHTGAGPAEDALALAPDGETFALDDPNQLALSGTLASGAPDPALGGRKGMRFAANLPGRRAGEEQQALALLAANSTLSILVGEQIVRVVA
jgi:uncharacterized delta-60 repeat protein